MKTTTNAGLKVNANIKAGGLTTNHSRAGLSVKAGIKAGGGMRPNHSVRMFGAQ